LVPHRLAPYLIGRGLLDPATVVDGDLTIVHIHRRHAGFQVRVRGGSDSANEASGYFVKHAVVSDREEALGHEAAVYESLRTVSASRLSLYLPEFVLSDPDAKLLVLELITPARTLRDYQSSTGRFPRTLASHLGKALAALHAIPLADVHLPPVGVPWVLLAHQPSFDFFCELSAASVELVSVLQRSEDLCRLLDEMREEWEADSLVHNDVRWDNCLVLSRGASRRMTGLKLIDWELAGRGNALWDVGSALSQYLAFWLLSIPAAADVSPRALPRLARHPIERMQPAIRTFWRTYVMLRGIERSRETESLIRGTRYAAAHLVQAAIENSQSAPRLTSFAVLCLQLALNVATEPERAAARLLGLDDRGLAQL
jgi:Phosphotransferase enzyme family